MQIDTQVYFSSSHKTYVLKIKVIGSWFLVSITAHHECIFAVCCLLLACDIAFGPEKGDA